MWLRFKEVMIDVSSVLESSTFGIAHLSASVVSSLWGGMGSLRFSVFFGASLAIRFFVLELVQAI